jgi:uncharacterized protein (TIGR03000 family)
MRRSVTAWALSLALPAAAAAAQDRPAADPAPGRAVSQAAPAAAAEARSRFRVTVPREDAELFIDGAEAPGTGTLRIVESGPLQRGRPYDRTLLVRWRPNAYTSMSRSRTVSFAGGDTVSVDLSVSEGQDRAEVRYVPTPGDIVFEMVKLAAITPDDVVYEPGCGDARITIAAVQAGAKKGVGIDLDAARVEESRAKVKASGLDDRIEIRQGDALDIKDLSDATVVFLYMGDEFDMLIRPILWRDLKVGARVVSHRFTMGDWKPDATEYVESGYELHLWRITDEVKRRARQP